MYCDFCISQFFILWYCDIVIITMPTFLRWNISWIVLSCHKFANWIDFFINIVMANDGIVIRSFLWCYRPYYSSSCIDVPYRIKRFNQVPNKNLKIKIFIELLNNIKIDLIKLIKTHLYLRKEKKSKWKGSYFLDKAGNCIRFCSLNTI